MNCGNFYNGGFYIVCGNMAKHFYKVKKDGFVRIEFVAACDEHKIYSSHYEEISENEYLTYQVLEK